MEAVSVYNKKYHIEISDVDFNKKLKLSTLFSFFQDIASEAVDNLGIGINTLEQKFGVSWILMRIRADITRNPEWNEDLFISTWPQEPKRLEFERDFMVKDSAGNIIIRAVSTWIIVDIKSRELKHSSLIAIEYPPIPEDRAITCRLGKLKAGGPLEEAYRKIVCYSDIDFNGHINNARYVDFISDCFSMNNHIDYYARSIEVNYINEALPGETIVLSRDLSNLGSNLIYIEGINETNNKVVFKTQVEVEKNNFTTNV